MLESLIKSYGVDRIKSLLINDKDNIGVATVSFDKAGLVSFLWKNGKWVEEV